MLPDADRTRRGCRSENPAPSYVGLWHETDIRLVAPEGPPTSGLPTLGAEGRPRGRRRVPGRRGAAMTGHKLTRSPWEKLTFWWFSLPFKVRVAVAMLAVAAAAMVVF